MAGGRPGSARPRYDLTTADHDYRVWDGPPRRTVLLCAHPRSGSTLLGEAIYFAGGLGCPLEYFHAGFRPDFAERWGAATTADYVDAVRRRRTDPSGVLSVKLFWPDVEALAQEAGVAGFAADAQPGATSPETYLAIGAMLAHIFPEASFVRLIRHDLLGQAVSIAIAHQTGSWRRLPGPEATAPAPEPHFDFAQIEHLIGFTDNCQVHWRNLFAAMGVTPRIVAYEDLAAGYDEVVRSLLTALGSDADPPRPRLQPQGNPLKGRFMLRYLHERAARAVM